MGFRGQASGMTPARVEAVLVWPPSPMAVAIASRRFPAAAVSGAREVVDVLALGAQGLIVINPDDGDLEQTLLLIAQLRRRGWMDRALITAPLTAQWATALTRCGPLEVQWRTEGDRRVGERHVRGRSTERAESLFLERVAPGSILAGLIRIAFSSGGGAPRVDSWADHLGISPRTLRRAWCQCFPEVPRSLRDWVVLAFLVDRMEQGWSLVRISVALGIDESTLHRVIARRVGRGPRCIDSCAFGIHLTSWLTAPR